MNQKREFFFTSVLSYHLTFFFFFNFNEYFWNLGYWFIKTNYFNFFLILYVYRIKGWDVKFDIRIYTSMSPTSEGTLYRGMIVYSDKYLEPRVDHHRTVPSIFAAKIGYTFYSILLLFSIFIVSRWNTKIRFRIFKWGPLCMILRDSPKK